jgi:small-conductance mechanosensitive channel
MEPAPLIVMTGFGQSSIDFLFGVWVAKENFIKVKNSIQDAVKIRFDEEGIEIPFPHLTLYSGSVTDPFPVAMQGSEPGDPTS